MSRFKPIAHLAYLMSIAVLACSLHLPRPAFAAQGFQTDPKTMPPGWNGNLCEPDSVRLCLGVQGLGRDEWVHCMRRHYAQLTPDCQKVMSPANFKTPLLKPEEADTVKAAPSMMSH